MKTIQKSTIAAMVALGLLATQAFGQYSTYPTQGYPVQQVPTYQGQAYQGQAIQGQPIQGYQQVPQGNYIPSYPQQNYQQPYQQQNFNQPLPPGTVAAPGTVTPGMTLAKSHWSYSLTPDSKDHDFGAVAKASNQERIFEFKNTLDTDLHLTAIYASCGCTKPKILTPVVKPNGIARILAKFDTVTFDGEKRATVTLRMEKRSPSFDLGELQFQVKGNIRRDVVLNPGEVSFADAKVNEAVQTTVKVNYAGDPRWKILDIQSSSKHITAEVVETQRDAYGRVGYDLVVKMNGEQPEGLINESLTLSTNDVRNQKMKVKVTGSVKPTLVVAPIKLGVVTEGDKISKRLIIRGSQPFEIKEILVNDQRIKFKPASGEKTLHVLMYDLDTSLPGDIQDAIKIVTSSDQEVTTVPFTAKIMPQVARDK